MSWRRRSRRLAACDARSRREIVNYPRRPAKLGHAFSLRVGWGDLFEEQGVVQETPGQAWLAMARDVGAAVLGERDRAGDRGLRSRSGKGRLAERDPGLGEREEIPSPGGSKDLGVADRGEGG